MSITGLSNIDDLTLHRHADLVPEPSAEDREALRLDIEQYGQLDPIEITTTGVILDGRTRWQILKAAGARTIVSRVVAMPESDQPEYIVRRALTRRHLSPEQKSDIARRLAAIVIDTGPQGELIGYSDKEIAETVGLTPKAVQKARSRDKSDSVGFVSPTHVRATNPKKSGGTKLVPKQRPREPSRKPPPARRYPDWWREVGLWLSRARIEDAKTLRELDARVHAAMSAAGITEETNHGD